MAKYQVEAGSCHGRGFSGEDANGFLSKLVSFLKRPAADGASQNFTADAGTDNITCGTHGYSTGDSVMVTTSGALPGGLAVSTEYYVIYVDANTFQLATTYANAVASTNIDITSAGTGTHSVYALGGGAEWYVFDDLSDVTAQNFATTDVDTGTEEITLTAHGLNTGRAVVFSTTGGLPAGLVAGTQYYAIRVDADTIQVATSYANAYAGTAINLTSVGTGTHTLTPRDPAMVFCDTASPAANDYDTGPGGLPPRFVKISFPTATAGRVHIQYAMWHNTTTHFTYGYWSGYYLETYDDADFAYDFRGGDEALGIGSRLGTAWDFAWEDEFVGDTNLLEAVSAVGTLQSGISAGDSVVLQLDTGEALNFTANKFYYLFDFNDVNMVEYVEVTNVDTGTDQITIDNSSYNFAAGSVICSYAHRWYTVGSNYDGSNNPNICGSSASDGRTTSRIPYCSESSASYSFHDQDSTIVGRVDPVRATDYLDRMVPDDEERYAVQRPGLVEVSRNNDTSSSQQSTQNRGYGITKNLYISVTGTLAQMLDGRVIGSDNFIYYDDENNLFYNGGSYLYACLVRDTESTS